MTIETKENISLKEEVAAKNWMQEEAPWVNDKENRCIFVGLCAMLGTAFLLIYNPLNVNIVDGYTWGGVISMKWAGLVGAVTLVFSQLVVRPLLNLGRFTNGQFLIWVIFEICLLALIFFFIYRQNIYSAQQELWNTFVLTIKIAMPPYIIACLLLMVREEWRRRRSVLNEKVPEEHLTKVAPKEYWTLRDENGKEQLILRPKELLLIESENNYINAVYRKGAEVKRKLIRNTLKNITNDFSSKELLRVHRSYIINPNTISHIERKKGKMIVNINHMKMNIPVSKLYEETLKKLM